MNIKMPDLSPRVRRVLRALGYAAFYWLMMLIFAFVTFPYDRLRDRIVREFNARQTGPDALRLELDNVSSYWLSGIEAEGVRLISPPKPGATAGSGDPAAVPKPSVMNIDSLHGRVGLLPLLFGTLRLSFGADAFGGNLSGVTSESDGTRRLEVELEELALDKAPLLADIVGLPLFGALNGSLSLVLPEGKLAKAEGKVALNVKDLSVGDGKAKIRETIALPKIDAGELKFDAEATNGELKIGTFSASGPDLELSADGKILLRDPAASSLMQLGARFRFLDRYKNKNETTRALFGEKGSKIGGLFDLDPKNQRAKSPDGFYGWRATGAFSNPIFTPHPGSSTSPARATRP